MTDIKPPGNLGDSFRLDGRVALITGAAGGFGSEIARGMAAQGADLVLTDIRPEALETLKNELAGEGRRVCRTICDIAHEAQVREAVACALREMGRIDVLVNVACAAKLDPLAKMSVEDFTQTIQSCLVGAFLITREVGAVMLEQGDGGSIIHVSSIAGARALGRGTGAYAAAKAGVEAMVRELAVEWAPHGIRVNAVAPCQFLTPGLVKVLEDSRLGGRAELEALMLANIPIGRFGNPREIVGPCIFLASQASAMVVGHTLYVDGGYTAK